MQLQRYQYIDPSHLLATVGGNLEIFQGLAQTFVSTAPPIFHNIEASAIAGDLPTLRRESHSLKGMSMLVGAQKLSELLREVETGARDGTPPSQQSLAELAGLFAQVQAEMTDCLQDNATKN